MIRKRTAVVISGNGSNLQALIDAARSEEYPASIDLVISNNPDAQGVARAKGAGVDCVVIDHRQFESRAAFDAAIQQQLEQHNIQIVCLAGFMRLLTEEFVHAWHGRMLNIHPSLLPAFKGANAIRDALAAGVKETGCSVHLVIPEMDAGPVLMQATVAVCDDDTEQTLRERIAEREHAIYPIALQKLAESF